MKRFIRNLKLYFSSPFLNISRFFSILFRKQSHKGPLMAAVSITSRCHTHCLMCWYHSPLLKKEEDFNLISPRELSVDVLKELFSDFKRLGGKRLFITGEGEPFNHPEILNILKLIKDLNLEFFLLTNLANLSLEKAKLLFESGIVHIEVSSHGVSENVLKEIYPVLHFRQIQDGIAGLEELIKIRNKFGRPRIEIIHAVFKQNIADLENMITQAVNLKVDKLTLKRGIFNSELKDRLNPTQEQLEKAYSVIRKYQNIKIRNNLISFVESLQKDSFSDFKESVQKSEKAGKPNIDNYKFCYIPYLSTNIESDGTVNPCIYDPFAPKPGNINNSSFRDIWFSKEYQNYRKERRCPVCLAFSLYPFMKTIKNFTGFCNHFKKKNRQ